MLKRKKNRILFILFLSVFLLNASFALAQKIEVQYPKLPLPFAAEPPQDFLKKIKDKEPGYTPEMMLPLYVKYFYSFAVLISGLVILGIITYGGFEILISAGNAGGMAAGRASSESSTSRTACRRDARNGQCRRPYPLRPSQVK